MLLITRVGLVAVLSGAAIACTGQLVGNHADTNAKTGGHASGGDSGAPGGGTGARNGGSGGTELTGGTGGDPPPLTESECVGKPVTPGRMPLRRLTATEYNNTVRDVLGDTLAPGNDFPPTGVGSGFDNDADAYTTQQVDVQAWLNASEAVAAAYRAAGKLKLSCASDGEACATTFIKTMGKKLFRRPVGDVEVTSYLTRFRAGMSGGTFEEGLEWVLGRMLMSPHFLYRVELESSGKPAGTVVPLNDYSMATRLSFFLWGTTPDDALMAAADAHELSTVDGVATQVKRMMAMPAFADTLASFHSQWVQWGGVLGAEKVTVTTPAFDAHLQAAMIRESELFVKSVFDGGGSFKDLLTASYTFVNPDLAKFYGVTYPGKADSKDFMKVDLPHRAGLLTQPSITAALSHPNQTAPVKRGLMIRSRMLCFDPPPPPMGLKIQLPEVVPGQSTRQRFEAHRAVEPCKSCHVYLDPLGMPLENYDEFGRYRDMDQGVAVDATGGFTKVASKGNVVDPALAPINGAADMGAQLAMLPEAQQCLVQNWFRFAAGHQEENSDACAVYSLIDRFKSSGLKLDDLVVALATSDSFRNRVDLAQ